VAERLDHLGIVAGVCREIGLAAWLDGQDDHSHERVGVGTATVAMILNGLGFSNRRLYLVSPFFANKPVERLLGRGITAEDLNDDYLGRALDWLYARDPTTLFAGIALRAQRAFGIRACQVHVDTSSFSVTGEYAAELEDLDVQTIAVTYGYSRDHRADLKQWMLALATTREGDMPLFCQALDGNASGNASDKVSLVVAVEALAAQLRAAAETAEENPGDAPLFVADSGLYSAENVARLSAAGGALDQPGARHLQAGACRAGGRGRRLAARRGQRVLGASHRGTNRRTLGGGADHPGRGACPSDAAAAGRAGAPAVGAGAVASE
jgi:hypothetical protein